jgi:HlyD family secretion protein
VSTETAPKDTTKGKKDTEGVFLVQGGVAQFRPVTVGIAGEEYFEVLDGLRQNDTIVAGPYQTIRDLKDSSRVRAIKGGPTAKESKP